MTDALPRPGSSDARAALQELRRAEPTRLDRGPIPFKHDGELGHDVEAFRRGGLDQVPTFGMARRATGLSAGPNLHGLKGLLERRTS